MSCLFCEIVAGRVPAKVAYKDDDIVAFHDVNPQGPTHVLVVPRRHITSLLDVTPADDALLGGLVRRARDLAVEQGLDERGFRLVFNCGDASRESERDKINSGFVKARNVARAQGDDGVKTPK